MVNEGLAYIEPLRYADFVHGIDIDKMSDSQLKKLVDFKFELEERERRYGILYYSPQEYQDKFHKSKKRVRFIFGANQVGKTECAVAEGIRISLGIDPYKKMPVPNRGRVIGTDLEKGVGEVLIPKYQKLVPLSEVDKITKYSTGLWKKIIYKNGSTVEFLSYEQDTKLFEGWTGHWVQFDEPPPQDKYIACIRGLMRWKGIVFGAMTPLNEPWIYDEIFLKAGSSPDQPDIFGFSIYDNKYLTPEAIKAFVDAVPDDEKDARVYGKFRHLSGLVFKRFGVEHRKPSFAIPKDWTVHCAMDYHPRVPCAIVWVAVDHKGMLYVFDELWADGTTDNICQMIVAKEKEIGIVPVARWIDSLSATPDRTNTSNACPQRDIMRIGNEMGYPLNFRSSQKNWVNGKNAIDDYLAVKNGVTGIVFFEDKVKRTILAMQRYMWGDSSALSPNGEKPAKGDAHFVDALRYVLVTRPQWIDKERQFEYLKEYRGHEISGYSYGG